MQLAAGTTLTPELKLLRLLDAGGMGSVWIAWHAQLAREVAVKFITEELRAAEPTVLDRFRREAAVLKQVDNEHIVQSYAQGTTDDGTPYIVMELLSGKDLVQFLLDRGSWLTIDEVVLLVEQLAEALSQIHQFDIVHRDIKAENVFVVAHRAELTVKLIDFGVAKVPDLPGSEVLTAPGALVGSPEYMSPEQIVSAASVDHLADLWGMAVLVYLALVLELPFHGSELADVFMAIKNRKYKTPSALRPELPETVDRFFERAFHPERVERFLSAAEMARAFKEAMPKTTQPARSTKSARTMVLLLLAALALVAITVAMIAF
jgi:serine/threonine protein kinase